MKVKSISEVSDSKVGVILQSNLMNEDIAALRKEKISIVLDSFEGLKVPNEALVETEKEEDGKTVKTIGVYVLNGQLVEGEEQRAEIFLSDLEADPGEKHNLADEMPELCNEMKEKALQWRNGIENTWANKFADNYKNLT